MNPIELTKRGKKVYFDLADELSKEEDFKRALIKSVEQDIEKHNCYKIDIIYWLAFNMFFTSEEVVLLQSFISKYGLLPLQDAIWKFYFSYSAEDVFKRVGLANEYLN